MIFKKIHKLFIGETFNWKVSLAPDQIEKILSARDQGKYFNSPAGITVLVKNHKFSFYKITIGDIPMSYNHMAHMLVGYIEQTETGSKVTARFQLPFFISLLLIFLLVIPSFITIVIILIDLRNHHVDKNTLFIFFPMAIMLTMKFLRKLAVKDEKKIISLMNDCFYPYQIK
ncbi:MAG: hypothetical protein H7336_07745 [Bacteriovorax sp.]|nr:hypothetical protein [Bacteriovorax sp.]